MISLLSWALCRRMLRLLTEVWEKEVEAKATAAQEEENLEVTQEAEERREWVCKMSGKSTGVLGSSASHGPPPS
jgi:hypothetical protein